MLRPFANPVACCWMLLCIVAASLKPVKLFSQQLPIFFCSVIAEAQRNNVGPFAELFQHCWAHARSLRMDYRDLWVVFFPRCTAGLTVDGSCCIRLHNIVGATMLGAVAPVCTQPYGTWLPKATKTWPRATEINVQVTHPGDMLVLKSKSYNLLLATS